MTNMNMSLKEKKKRKKKEVSHEEQMHQAKGSPIGAAT